MLVTLLPNAAGATCGEECDSDYASAIDDCKSQYDDDPADADDLATCIQEARDSYRSCLDNCAADATPLPSRRRLAFMLARIQATARHSGCFGRPMLSRCFEPARPAGAITER